MTRTLSYGNLRRYAIFLPLGGQQYSQFSVVTNFNLVSFQLSICKQAVLCKQKIDKNTTDLLHADWLYTLFNWVSCVGEF